jgi:hypothetical protein
MKNWILVLMLAVQASAWAETPAVDGGTEGGNGGDPVAAEVTRTLMDVLAHLRVTPTLYPTIDRDTVERTILALRVNVMAGETVICDIEGERRNVVACNHPSSGELDVARDGWHHTAVGNGDQFRLAAHELLGLLRLQDTGYLYSGRIRDSRRQAIAQSFVGVFDVRDISGMPRDGRITDGIRGPYQIRRVGETFLLRPFTYPHMVRMLDGAEIPLEVDFARGSLYSSTFRGGFRAGSEFRADSTRYVSVEVQADSSGFAYFHWFISGENGSRYLATTLRRPN